MIHILSYSSVSIKNEAKYFPAFLEMVTCFNLPQNLTPIDLLTVETARSLF